MSPVEAVDADRLLRTSLELDAIDSPTGHEQEIGAHHETTFADLGCATTRDDVGNLVADLVTACRVLVAIVTQHGDRTTDREGAPA